MLSPADLSVVNAYTYSDSEVISYWLLSMPSAFPP